jgi:hypothetical protein
VNRSALDPTLDALRRSWEQAARTSTLVTRSLEVAGLHLQIVAAGGAVLDQLVPALDHHPAVGDLPGAGAPDLVLHLWDLRATRAERPPLPREMFDEHAATLHDTVVTPTATVRFEPASQMLTAWDPGVARAWCCVADADEIVWWDRAAPFRSLLGWWLEANERQLIHGAAVGDEAGAVVLAGPGGSGKSTTALSAHLAGLGYLGDDYCAVSHHDGPVVHSLYGTAKLRLDDHDRNGPLAHRLLHADPDPHEKAVALVTGLPGTRVIEHAPVRAVVAVRVAADGVTRVVRASRAEVLTALAPSSILQLPGTTGATLAGLARLVRSAPVAVLELGRDRDELVDTVGRLAGGSVFA